MSKSIMKIKNFFLAGISSELGLTIAEELMKHKGINVTGMLKDCSKETDQCKSRLDKLKSKGLKVIEGDVCNPEKYQEHLKDVHVVISTLQGGKDCIVDGQRKLLKCARKEGNLRYFFPSDFVIDYSQLTNQEFPFIAWKKEFGEWADTQKDEKLKIVHVFNGCFMELFFHSDTGIVDMDPFPRVLNYYGTYDVAFELITMKDTAKFICASLFDDATMPPSRFHIVGDITTPKEIVEVYNKFNGKDSMVLNKKGDYSDLQKEFKNLREKFKNENIDFHKYIPYSLQLTIFRKITSKANIETINSRYPEVTPLTVAEYLQTEKLSSG